MNILKPFISFMLAAVGMFISPTSSATTINGQAVEIVLQSYEECMQYKIAYTPVGRNAMTRGTQRTIAEYGFPNGTCVRSPQVVKRINGRPQVVEGWVFLLPDFLTRDVNGAVYMEACSNPIAHMGAPLQTEVRTQVNTSAVAQQSQVVERVVYVDRPQQQVVYAQPQQRERYCDRHPGWCAAGRFFRDVGVVGLGTFAGQGLCNNNEWCNGNQGDQRSLPYTPPPAARPYGNGGNNPPQYTPPNAPVYLPPNSPYGY